MRNGCVLEIIALDENMTIYLINHIYSMFALCPLTLRQNVSTTGRQNPREPLFQHKDRDKLRVVEFTAIPL
jgi:hypothetical protein